MSESIDSNHYGPLQQFLSDPEVEEIWINSPQRIFIAKRGRSQLTNLILDSQQIQREWSP